MMLLVSSMEALIIPRPEWRKEKATKRFIEGIDALCPAVVEELVNHPNVERAFSYTKKGGQDAASSTSGYDLRTAFYPDAFRDQPHRRCHDVNAREPRITKDCVAFRSCARGDTEFSPSAVVLPDRAPDV